MTEIRGIRRWVVAMALLVAGILGVSAAQKVELRVDPGSRSGVIEEGSTFYIKIIVSNINEAPSAPKSVPGARVVYFAHQSSSSSFSSVNGQVSQSVVNIYAVTLKAESKGSYTFGPISVGGVKSNTVSYTVAAPGSAPQPYAPNGGGAQGGQNPRQPGQSAQTPDPASQGPTFIGKGNDKLFLRANVSKTTAYEQEALVYTVKLYTTYNSIKFIGATDAPKFDGFVIEESDNISKELTFENYQGQTYATAVIARYIIFPQMPGQLKIIGNKYTVSTDAEEYYHDPFFMQLVTRKPIQLNVTPNDLVVNVKPLPSPRPADFSGGVGQFTISSDLPSSDAVANQASSVSYLITGQGNLKYIHLPELNSLFPDELEVFTPQSDVKAVVGSSNVSGSVNFDYSFMPLEAGTFEIPPVRLVYFNPSTGSYETSTSRGYRLKVARGAESEKSQAAMTYDSRLMPVELATVEEARPMVRGVVYWLLYIVPAVALTCALIGHRRYLADRADMAGLRSRRAGRMARRRLRMAAACIRRNDEDGFYDEMLKALWGYLSDKLRLPTSELNRENVSQILADHGVSGDAVNRLLSLLDECEFAKYSPASSRKSVSDVYAEGEQVLNGLEDEFNKRPKAGASERENNDYDEILK